ncbi:tyrosine-type recombinase/integrase [Photobacterium swingsii]|uniref:tyrosine-type recombinase/integrase n=1 Tax=Photobacterium swingsii TaxID=680026 RepID=UPI00406954FF
MSSYQRATQEEINECITSLKGLVDDVEKDRERLWEVPLSNSVSIGVVPAASFILENLSICRERYQRWIKKSSGGLFELDRLRSLMLDEGVIVPGHSSSALELRRNILVWWKELTLDEKKSLEVFGNKVKFKKYIKKYRSGKGYEIVTETFNDINREMLELGLLNNSYVEVKDRAALRDSARYERAQDKVRHWNDLGKLPLDNVNDLVLPAENLEDYVQMKQLFAAKTNAVPSDSGQRNYINAYPHVCRFLKQSSVPETSLLKDILSPFIATRFKQYLVDKIDTSSDDEPMSSSHARTIQSCFNQVLNRAKQIKGLGFESFYEPSGIPVSRQRYMYKPYAVGERSRINDALRKEVDGAKRFLKPYKKVGVGEYPLDDDFNVIPKLNTKENARYLFENCLNCRPASHANIQTPEEKAFLAMLRKHGLKETYNEWGVLNRPDREIIAPFLVRLAQITGMNHDPLLMLELDDLELEHAATGKPCLRYWKERSTGDKAYHLDLFDAKLQWLTVSQSKDVSDIFESVIKLTASIRESAPESIKNRLFIHESSGAAAYGKVMSLSDTHVRGYLSNVEERYELKDDDGKPSKLNIARFRPSFVSDMVEAGVSIREIQLMLGHGSIETTMKYLDRLDFNRIAREKVSEALNNIHKKVFSEKKKENSESKNTQGGIIFQTPLGGCANIFNPPDFIKNLKSYVKGQACSQYNKCLSCENVMLTEQNLPELFAMKRDYTILIQRNRIADTPYGIVVMENLGLLEEILSPETSDFDEEDLERGERLSMHIETAIIDGVGA